MIDSDLMPDTARRRVHSRIIPPVEDYFMGLVMVEAAMCRDPISQQAARIVNRKHHVISLGLTTLARPAYKNAQNPALLWDDEGRSIGLIYADEAAVKQALKRFIPGSTSLDPLSDCIMYLSGPPSLQGVKESGTYGLKKIIYGPVVPDYFNVLEWEKTKKLAKIFDVDIVEFKGNLNWLRDRVQSVCDLF